MIITDMDTLINMWAEDSKLDSTEITRETARIGQLESKYLGIRTRHSLRAKKAAVDYNKMAAIRRSYYRCEMEKEDLDTYGWDQWVHNKVLNNQMDEFLGADPILTEMSLKKAIHDEIVDFCTYVLKEVHNRTWQCKTILESEKFYSGNYA